MFFAGGHSPLSNLHPCTISNGEHEFTSSEQYFQYEKCLAHKRRDIAVKVLAATTPREAMYKGKEVKCSQEWNKNHGVKIMKTVLEAKLAQVDSFRNILESYPDKTLVEASRDPVWGIGIPFSAQNIVDDSTWNGSNLMGHVLSELIK